MDGEPTDDNGYDQKEEFKTFLRNVDPEQFKFGILACTTDDNVVEFLNDIDRTVDKVDVLDDYASEYKEVIKVQGPKFQYTFGDHVVRLMLGPIMQKYDDMDEKKFESSSKSSTKNKNIIEQNEKNKQNKQNKQKYKRKHKKKLKCLIQ